jgi:Flp pilus assembly protein TadG
MIASFLRDVRGGVTTIFALALPALALIVAGAIEIAELNGDRQATQDVADAAALMGARQLATGASGVEQRVDDYANGQLAEIGNRTAVTVSTAVTTNAVTVTITTSRGSFFGNLLPPGGFHTQVQATAVTLGSAPLCVLAIAPGSSDGVSLGGSSQIQAAGCAVDSNQFVSVASGNLQAAETFAATTASGAISPSPLTGAPVIADPFAGLNIAAPSSCAGVASQGGNIPSDTTLQPGVHCGDFTMVGHATLTLAPGEHYFEGNLSAKGGSLITGTDVVLVFGPTSVLDLKGAANISLTGRKSGALAGFVIAVDRAATGTFTLQTDPFTNITGAIYVPTAVLNLDGTHQAAQASQWTVVTARSLTLTGSPDLVINSSYAGSSVPVPSGVGPRQGGPVSLTN